MSITFWVKHEKKRKFTEPLFRSILCDIPNELLESKEPVQRTFKVLKVQFTDLKISILKKKPKPDRKKSSGLKQ